jgi:hypothetical protein
LGASGLDQDVCLSITAASIAGVDRRSIAPWGVAAEAGTAAAAAKTTPSALRVSPLPRRAKAPRATLADRLGTAEIARLTSDGVAAGGSRALALGIR